MYEAYKILHSISKAKLDILLLENSSQLISSVKDKHENKGREGVV
jgi:hypothetical protein